MVSHENPAFAQRHVLARSKRIDPSRKKWRLGWRAFHHRRADPQNERTIVGQSCVSTKGATIPARFAIEPLIEGLCARHDDVALPDTVHVDSLATLHRIPDEHAVGGRSDGREG